MSSATSLFVQKGLLALSVTTVLIFLCVLAKRRFGAMEEMTRARNNLIVEVLANVSEGLDRIEAGLDDIAARAAVAKTKLNQFAELRRKNFLTCTLLRERKFKAVSNDGKKRFIEATSKIDNVKSRAHVT